MGKHHIGRPHAHIMSGAATLPQATCDSSTLQMTVSDYQGDTCAGVLMVGRWEGNDNTGTNNDQNGV